MIILFIGLTPLAYYPSSLVYCFQNLYWLILIEDIIFIDCETYGWPKVKL